MSASKPYILGVTGGIATGKTAACEVLKSLGAKVIDADEISRALTAEGGAALTMIFDAFGKSVFSDDRTLNRRALAERIFNDARERRRLEDILHPMVIEETILRIDNFGKQGSKVVVLNVPILLESGMDAMCDGYWVMAAEPEEQVLRLIDRDHLTPEQARARIAAQWPLERKVEGAAAVIYTDRCPSITQEEISRLYVQLLKSIDAKNRHA